MKQIKSIDVIQHLHSWNIYPLCTRRGGKKGTIDDSAVSSTELAQIIIIDSVLMSIEKGVSRASRGTDIAQQLAQLSPNYVQSFLGGLTSLGLMDVSKDKKASVFRPNMDFARPEAPLYIQLGAPMALGARASTIKTGEDVLRDNFFLVSPRAPFARTDHPHLPPENKWCFDGYWIVSYNFSNFIEGKPIAVFAAYGKEDASINLRETWLAINNVDPMKLRDAKFNLHMTNYWHIVSPEYLKGLGVITSDPDPELVKSQLFDPSNRNVGVLVKDAIVAGTGQMVIDNNGEVKEAEIKEVDVEPEEGEETAAVEEEAIVVSKPEPIPNHIATGVADDYIPRKPADFTPPVGNPFERAMTKTEPPAAPVTPLVAEKLTDVIPVTTIAPVQPTTSVPEVPKGASMLYSAVSELIYSNMSHDVKEYMLRAIVAFEHKAE